MTRSVVLLCASTLSVLATAGCEEGSSSSSIAASVPKDSPNNVVLESCHSSDPEKICIGLKYVTYTDAQKKPVTDLALAKTNVAEFNRIWAKCGIAFQLERYDAIQPADFSLNYSVTGETDLIRRTFEEDTRFVIVSSGPFNFGSANAWTNSPGSPPYGVIVEANTANYASVIAHELGHYMNLDHVGDSTNLMNAVIYSTGLTNSQCTAARSSVRSFWPHMLR